MGQIHFENVTVVMDSKNIIYRYHQHLFSDKYNNKYTHSTIYGKYNGLYLYLYNMNLNFFQIFIFAVMDIGAKCTYLTCSKGPRGQLT